MTTISFRICSKNTHKKNKTRFKLKGLLFSSSVKNDTEKIFLQTVSLSDAKFGLINEKYKQTIGVINLNKITSWSKIKEISRWVNVNFQEQSGNKNTHHFSYNFITNNKEDLLKLVDSDNNTIEFDEGEKKLPIINFMIEFLA